MNTKDVLKSALKKIQNGWCQGEYHEEIKGKTHYCLLGAIEASTNNLALRKRANDRIKDYLGDYTFSLAYFNDSTNKFRVVEVLKNVIKSIK